MPLTAADTQTQAHPAIPTILIVLLTGATIYSFGYVRAVMHRANQDYKTTKAAVPTLRKSFWSAWFKAVKVGFFIVLAAVVLGMWAWHDVSHRSGPAANLSPSPSHSSVSVQPSPRHSNR